MPRPRKDSLLKMNFQEYLARIISDVVSKANEENIIPAPCLFINQKYEPAHRILHRLDGMLDPVKLSVKEEKLKSETQWKHFDSDDDLKVLADRKKAKVRLIRSLERQFRKTKTDLEVKLQENSEKRDALRGDEQRKTLLVTKKRTEMIANFASQRIELGGKEESIVRNAGCCGLSKKKKKELADVQEALRKVDASINEIRNKEDSGFNIYDQEFENIEIQYKQAKKKLRNHVRRFPKKIQAEKDKLDKLEVLFNQKENNIQVIRNRFSSHVSNRLMYSLLRLYLCFLDFSETVRQIESSSDELNEFKNNLISVKAEADRVLETLWCPESKDRNGEQLLSYILEQPEHKKTLLETVEPDDATLNILIPRQHGNILPRIKEGDTTGVNIRPTDVLAFPVAGEVRSSIRMSR